MRFQNELLPEQRPSDVTTVRDLIDAQFEDMKSVLVYAPDSRMLEHPVKVARGDWTAMIGILVGTFTNPMPIGNGKWLAPTGRFFTIGIATFGHWSRDGVMESEYILWDKQELMRQVALVKPLRP